MRQIIVRVRSPRQVRFSADDIAGEFATSGAADCPTTNTVCLSRATEPRILRLPALISYCTRSVTGDTVTVRASVSRVLPLRFVFHPISGPVALILLVPLGEDK